MTRTINVALVGSKFMGRAHSNAWLNVAKFFDCDPQPVMHTVVGRNADELAAFAERWGWGNSSTDWRAAITDEAIDLVDIGTPNNVHAEQAIAALEAGKHVACEKPLAGTLADAETMAAAAAAAAGQTFVWYNYRRVPAVALAHQLVAWRRARVGCTTPAPSTCRVGAARRPRCSGGSRAMSQGRERTAT